MKDCKRYNHWYVNFIFYLSTSESVALVAWCPKKEIAAMVVLFFVLKRTVISDYSKRMATLKFF